MKKFSVALISILMVLCLVACGSETTSKYTLSYKEGKMVNMNDTNLVGVFFSFTNDSGETVLPCDAIDVKAFQNGKEITIMVYTGQKTEGAIQCDTSVQSGTTADVVWLFQPDDNSKVFVECSDGQKIEFEIN